MTPERFEISGLFGRKKLVEIDLQNKVMIIFGINGSGKTTVLKLLHAILTGRFYEILNTNFKSLTLWLKNGKTIKATRSKRQVRKEGNFRRYPCKLTLSLVLPDGKIEQETEIINEEEKLSESLPLGGNSARNS